MAMHIDLDWIDKLCNKIVFNSWRWSFYKFKVRYVVYECFMSLHQEKIQDKL